MTEEMMNESEIIEKLSKIFDNEIELNDAFNNLAYFVERVPRRKSVILHFDRILDTYSHLIIKELFSTPNFLYIVLHLFALSDWIAHAMVKDPGIINWLKDKWMHGFVRGREDLAEELARYILLNRSKNLTEVLIEFKKREFIRIAALDFILLSEFNECVLQLSILADVIIEAIYVKEWGEHVNKYGLPQFIDDVGNLCEACMSILSLGKFGSNELNYNSDIDLILIYSHDGETSGGTAHKLSNKEFFTRLSLSILSTLSEEVESGTLYKVDVDLRPEGKSGDLIVSLAQAHYYYKTGSHRWEKLALVRLRHTAGDATLSDQFISMIAPIVALLTNDENLFKEIYEMKLRMNTKLDLEELLERDIKSGKGGIREIEFIAQTLYAFNYDDIHFSESANTLKLIHALVSKRYLTSDEHELLSHGYKYLRTCEHLLQIMFGRQIHALPVSGEALAHFTEIASSRAESEDRSIPNPIDYIAKLKADINALFEKIFLQHLQVKLDEHVDIEELLFVPPLDAHKLLHGLNYLKIPDGEHYLADLKNLVTRISSFHKDYFNNNHLRKLLLGSFVEIIHKDNAKNGLKNYDLLLFSLKDKPEVLEWLLKNEGIMSTLTEVFCTNDVASSLIWASPELLMHAAQGIHLQLKNDIELEAQSIEELMDTTRMLKHSATISAALIEAEGLFGRIQVQKIISAFVKKLIKKAMDWLTNSYLKDSEPGSLLTFSMGRLSLNEFDYQSDLDMLWVYCHRQEESTGLEPKTNGEVPFEFEINLDLLQEDAQTRSTYLQVVQQFIKVFTMITSKGYLYKVDMRLRPNGDEGELAVSDDYMYHYIKTAARPWELFAYYKLSYIAGDMKIAETFLSRLLMLISARIGQLNLREEILSIRRSYDETYHKDHIKYGYGNLMDINFFLQYIQIFNNVGFSMTRGTMELLRLLLDQNIITTEDYQQIFYLWNELESIVHLARMRNEESLLDKPLNEIMERLSFKRISFSDLDLLRKQMRDRLLHTIIKGSHL